MQIIGVLILILMFFIGLNIPRWHSNYCYKKHREKEAKFDWDAYESSGQEKKEADRALAHFEKTGNMYIGRFATFLPKNKQEQINVQHRS